MNRVLIPGCKALMRVANFSPLISGMTMSVRSSEISPGCAAARDNASEGNVAAQHPIVEAGQYLLGQRKERGLVFHQKHRLPAARG